MESIPAEWTFEAARRCWKPMVRPAQHVGVPGYQFQTAVLWDGSLVFGPLGFRELTVMQRETAPLGNNLLHLAVGFGSPMRFIDRKGTGSPAVRRWLEEGRLPLPTVETDDGDLVWQESVFAHLLGRPLEAGLEPHADDVLVTQARFAVRNRGPARRTAHLWLHFGDTSQVHFGYKCGVGPELAPALEHTYQAPYGMLEGKVRYVLPAPAQGAVRWHDQVPVEGLAGPAKRVLEWEVPLQPDQEAGLTLILPYGLVERPVAERLPALASEPRARGMAAFGTHASRGRPRSAPDQGRVGIPEPWLRFPEGGSSAFAMIPEPWLRFPRDRSAPSAGPFHLPGAPGMRELTIHSWEALLDAPGRITTPDPFINDYLAAVAGQMAQQVACRTRTGVWMYKTSPNHYEGYWPCNAAKALPAFDLRGLTKLSRPVLGSFVTAQRADVGGLAKRGMGQGEALAGEGFEEAPGFLGNFGEWTANPLLLSHGLGLWALASHYRITRSDVWLGKGPGSPLHAMIQGFDWVARQRRRTMREENGQKVPHWGLLPAASAHDWLAGNTIFNDAFCIFGMAEVVRLLREIHHPRAEEMARELADYRACLHDRYREARDRARPLPLPDGTLLPFVPRIVQELDWTKPDWTITGYGPLRAGAWGALDPHDALVDQALAFLEAGMPKGEGPYFSAHKEHADTADTNWADISDSNAERHYLWRHYVEYETMWPVGGALFLARDDLPRFFEWLFHNLAVVLHQDWRVGVESLDGVPSCAPGEGERWQAIRAMFVNESGGYDGSEQSLWLLQAIPRSWLRPGDRLRVERMGTRFGGSVDLSADVARDGHSVSVSAGLGLKVLPTEVRLRLRSGDGRPLASATVNGRPARVLEGDTILLPRALRGRYRVVGQFGSGEVAE